MEEHETELDPVELTGPLVILSRSHLAYMNKELKPHGFGWVDFEFIMILNIHKEGVSQEHLTKVLKVGKATTTRTMQKLEAEGYVSRVRDDADRRAYKLYLTDKGKDVQELFRQKMTDWINIVYSDFTLEEREAFRMMLHKAMVKAFYLDQPPMPPNGTEIFRFKK